MKKYIQSDTIQKEIDWQAIMVMPRYAGGHDEQMRGLFKAAKLVAHWNEGDYQGMVATYVTLDGKHIIYNDWYGSCSGCDSWENASDETVRSMCIALANSAYIFTSLADVKEFLYNVPKDDNWSWQHGAAEGLLSKLA